MRVTMTGYNDAFNDLSGKISRISSSLPKKWASDASDAYYRAYRSLIDNFYHDYKPKLYQRTYKFAHSGRQRNSRNDISGGLTVSSTFMHGDYKTTKADFVLNQIWNQQIRYHHPITHSAIPFDAHIESFIGSFSGAAPHALMEQFQDAYQTRILDAQCNADIIRELNS